MAAMSGDLDALTRRANRRRENEQTADYAAGAVIGASRANLRNTANLLRTLGSKGADVTINPGPPVRVNVHGGDLTHD